VSNIFAVATVTEALCQFLQRNLRPEIDFQVEVSPRKPPADPPVEPTITVFCYQVSPNGALRNRDAPTRAADGTLVNRPQSALDLHYLISFYGNETQLVAQKLLGSVVRALYEEPNLSRADIELAAQQTFLAGTDLAAAPDRVRFTPTNIDIDDMYKLWTMLNQTPFTLSLTYLASVVVIDGRAPVGTSKPVLRRTVRAVPGERPQIARLLAQPPGQPPVEGPVPRDSALVIEGRGLSGVGVWARIANTDIAVPADQVRDDRLVLPLPDTLPPGVYPLRIVQDVQADPVTLLSKVLESNAATLVRQPRITEAAPAAGPTGARLLRVALDLPVGDGQRARALLDELVPGAGAAPARSYQLDAPFPLGERPDRQTVLFPVGGVAPGRYLVRVQVDGATSPLEPLADGTFGTPVVDLTGTT
jgi:hypothetical protein